MKIVVAFAIAGILLMVSATVGLAAHGPTNETVPMPAHGSVWFGYGVAQLQSNEVVPLHGSVWMGEGLARFGVETQSVNTFDTAMMLRGAAHDWVTIQPVAALSGYVNSYDVAMILRGCCNGQVDRESVVLALATIE